MFGLKIKIFLLEKVVKSQKVFLIWSHLKKINEIPYRKVFMLVEIGVFGLKTKILTTGHSFSEEIFF